MRNKTIVVKYEDTILRYNIEITINKVAIKYQVKLKSV